jgi:hypothetical protein
LLLSCGDSEGRLSIKCPGRFQVPVRAWCVLYQSVDPRLQYLRGTQARQLRVQLNERRPVGGEIVDYEFYHNSASSEQGWLIKWKHLACRHTPNFHKHHDTRIGELPVVIVVINSLINLM